MSFAPTDRLTYSVRTAPSRDFMGLWCVAVYRNDAEGRPASLVMNGYRPSEEAAEEAGRAYVRQVTWN